MAVQFDTSAKATTVSTLLKLFKWAAWIIAGGILILSLPAIPSMQSQVQVENTVIIVIVAAVFYFIGKGIESYHNSILVTTPTLEAPQNTQAVARVKEKSTRLSVSPGRRKLINEVAEETAFLLYFWALFDEQEISPDDPLAAYRQQGIDNDTYGTVLFETWFYGIFLTAKKAERYLNPDELEYFILKLFSLLSRNFTQGKGGVAKEDLARYGEQHLLARWYDYMENDASIAYYHYLVVHPEVAQLGDERVRWIIRVKSDSYSSYDDIDSSIDKLQVTSEAGSTTKRKKVAKKPKRSEPSTLK